MCCPYASSSIVCDDSVSESTKKYFEFGAEIQIRVKGVAYPIRVYNLKAEKASTSTIGSRKGQINGFDSIYLVGRKSELQRIDETVSAWVHSNMQKLILITGDSGSGKTSIGAYAEAALRSADQNDSIVYW
jgi:DNA-binding NtrC family response regulator